LEKEQDGGRKCTILRPKSRSLHTLGTYLRFWKVFGKTVTAGKRNIVPREFDKTGSMSRQVGYN
jgi:hypothetical protein